ncbi:hypothetical protein FRB95_003879 [Tulasnella sp. JGI-2019a]|nr:hypothetical protein FRB95_003879 [Tulasnella sp. JGI-2019a]
MKDVSTQMSDPRVLLITMLSAVSVIPSMSPWSVMIHSSRALDMPLHHAMTISVTSVAMVHPVGLPMMHFVVMIHQSTTIFTFSHHHHVPLGVPPEVPTVLSVITSTSGLLPDARVVNEVRAMAAPWLDIALEVLS